MFTDHKIYKSLKYSQFQDRSVLKIVPLFPQSKESKLPENPGLSEQD